MLRWRGGYRNNAPAPQPLLGGFPCPFADHFARLPRPPVEGLALLRAEVLERRHQRAQVAFDARDVFAQLAYVRTRICHACHGRSSFLNKPVGKSDEHTGPSPLDAHGDTGR